MPKHFAYESTEFHSDPKETTETKVTVRNGKGTKVYTKKNKRTGRKASHKERLTKKQVKAMMKRQFIPTLFHSAKRHVTRRLKE